MDGRYDAAGSQIRTIALRMRLYGRERKTMRTFFRTIVFGIILAVVGHGAAIAAETPADEVTNWNQMLFRAGLVGGTSPLFISRVAAIVQTAVFDAVNGIDRRYAPIHVPPGGP